MLVSSLGPLWAISGYMLDFGALLIGELAGEGRSRRGRPSVQASPRKKDKRKNREGGKASEIHRKGYDMHFRSITLARFPFPGSYRLE